MWRPMLAAAASTYCMSAEPSSSGGVPTPMNWIVPCATAAATSVVNCRRPAAALRCTSASSPGSWMGMPPSLRTLDLARVDVQADDVVAHFGQAGACDQTDIAGADDGDFHVRGNLRRRDAGDCHTGAAAAACRRPPAARPRVTEWYLHPSVFQPRA